MRARALGKKFILLDISQISSIMYVLPERVKLTLDTARKHKDFKRTRYLALVFNIRNSQKSNKTVDF